MIIEGDKKEIERNKRSLHALYRQEGDSLMKLIDYCAESMAYKTAVIEDLKRALFDARRTQEQKEKNR